MKMELMAINETDLGKSDDRTDAERQELPSVAGQSPQNLQSASERLSKVALETNPGMTVAERIAFVAGAMALLFGLRKE